MKIYLLDINVLMALLWTNHEQHEAASQWFQRHNKSGWASCPLTQAGFVRISSNPRVFSHEPSPAKAVEILEANLKHPKHHFFKDELNFSAAIKSFGENFSGHQQTTDAYLLGLAIHKNAILATFDRSIAALAGTNDDTMKSLEIL